MLGCMRPDESYVAAKPIAWDGVDELDPASMRLSLSARDMALGSSTAASLLEHDCLPAHQGPGLLGLHPHREIVLRNTCWVNKRGLKHRVCGQLIK